MGDSSDDDTPISQLPTVGKASSMNSNSTHPVVISVDDSSDDGIQGFDKTSKAAGKKTASNSGRSSKKKPAKDDSSDEEILGFNKTNKAAGKKAAGKKSGSGSSSSGSKKKTPAKDDDDDSSDDGGILGYNETNQCSPCESCGKADDPSKYVACTSCNEGGAHTYCCEPKIVGEPPDDFRCQHCLLMAKSDPLVRSCALVKAKFEGAMSIDYPSGVYVGEVIDVGYKPIQDGEEDERPGPRGKAKAYTIYFPADGAEMLHDIEAKKCEERVLPFDEELTEERRKRDPLLKGRGARGVVTFPDLGQRKGRSSFFANVTPGPYPGRIIDVRVEKAYPYASSDLPKQDKRHLTHLAPAAGKVHYLVQYDEGDRHWHELGHPMWKWKPEAGASLAKPGAPLDASHGTEVPPSVSRQSSLAGSPQPRRAGGSADDPAAARRAREKAIEQLRVERRNKAEKEERERMGRDFLSKKKKEGKDQEERRKRERPEGGGGSSSADGGEAAAKRPKSGDGDGRAADASSSDDDDDDDDDDDESEEVEVDYEDDDESDGGGDDESGGGGAVALSARDIMRRQLAAAFASPLAASSSRVEIPALPAGIPRLVGEAIEAALHEYVESEAPDKYNGLGRTLIANLKKNATLRTDIYCGAVSTHSLVRMKKDELAPNELKLARQASKDAASKAVTLRPEHIESGGLDGVDWRDGTNIPSFTTHHGVSEK